MIPTQREVLTYRSIYGDPRGRGGATVSPTWYAKNIVMVVAPWPMAMGNIKITRIPFHREAAPALVRAFDGLWKRANGNLDTIRRWGVDRFGGTFNYRPARGLVTLSMHAFGIAIDLDPERNGLGDATPRFAEFPEVLKAFADAGFMWGGDWDGDGSSADERRPDGMHWQLTRRA